MATEKRLIDATPLIDECRECMNIEWNKSVYATWAEAEEDFMDVDDMSELPFND